MTKWKQNYYQFIKKESLKWCVSIGPQMCSGWEWDCSVFRKMVLEVEWFKADPAFRTVDGSTASVRTCCCLSAGPADHRDISTHWDPWRHGTPDSQDLLQHLPGQPQPHQPDHGQSHAHTDAQRHLHTHGNPGCEFPAHPGLNYQLTLACLETGEERAVAKNSLTSCST